MAGQNFIPRGPTMPFYPEKPTPYSAWLSLQDGQQPLPYELAMADMGLMQNPQEYPSVPMDVPEILNMNAPLPPTKTKTQQTFRDKTVEPLSKSDYDELAQRLNEKGIESLKLQSQGIGDLEQLRNDILGVETQTNLSPLMALMDNLSTRGSKNALASYQAPTSGEDRQAQIRQAQAQIQRAREGMSSQEMDLLKSQLGIAAQKEQALMRQEESAKDRELRERLAGMMKEKILPAGVIDKYNEGQTTIGLATGLTGSISKNAHLMGPVKGREGILNPYSEEQKILIAEFDGVKQRIAKLMEGGVLRKEDEAKYAKILPTITDLPEVAQDKARRIEAMLKEDMARYMENFGKGGYKVEGFAADTAQYKKDFADLQSGKSATVERKDANGKTAIFDAKTKEFIRYK